MLEFLSSYWWAFGLGTLCFAVIAAIWQFKAVAGAPKAMLSGFTNVSSRPGESGNLLDPTAGDPISAVQQGFSRTASRLIGPAVMGVFALGCAVCGGIGLVVAAVEYFKASGA